MVGATGSEVAWPHFVVIQGEMGTPPHVLSIHLSGNFLRFVKGKLLVVQAMAVLELIRSRWSGM